LASSDPGVDHPQIPVFLGRNPEYEAVARTGVFAGTEFFGWLIASGHLVEGISLEISHYEPLSAAWIVEYCQG
jgi:hypothetical protein